MHIIAAEVRWLLAAAQVLIEKCLQGGAEQWSPFRTTRLSVTTSVPRGLPLTKAWSSSSKPRPLFSHVLVAGGGR